MKRLVRNLKVYDNKLLIASNYGIHKSNLDLDELETFTGNDEFDISDNHDIASRSLDDLSLAALDFEIISINETNPDQIKSVKKEPVLQLFNTWIDRVYIGISRDKVLRIDVTNPSEPITTEIFSTKEIEVILGAFVDIGEKNIYLVIGSSISDTRPSLITIDMNGNNITSASVTPVTLNFSSNIDEESAIGNVNMSSIEFGITETTEDAALLEEDLVILEDEVPLRADQMLYLAKDKFGNFWYSVVGSNRIFKGLDGETMFEGELCVNEKGNVYRLINTKNQYSVQRFLNNRWRSTGFNGVNAREYPVNNILRDGFYVKGNILFILENNTRLAKYKFGRSGREEILSRVFVGLGLNV